MKNKTFMSFTILVFLIFVNLDLVTSSKNTRKNLDFIYDSIRKEDICKIFINEK